MEEMPEPLLSKPDLSVAALWYWEAFVDLCSCRSYTFGGAGPIPWTAIDQYATRHGYGDSDSFESFKACVSHLDSLYLVHHQKEIDRGR